MTSRPRARYRLTPVPDAGIGGLLALASLAFGTLASAQNEPVADALYDVELVVFQNLDTASYGSPEVPAMPGTDEATAVALPDAAAAAIDESRVEPADSAAVMPDFVTDLPAERRVLDAIEAALKRSAGYRPVAHVGWSQPGRPRGTSEAISLDDRLAGTGLTGTARLSVGRYLHLDVELRYTGEDGRPRTLKQSRRMRSGERHYFDDPLIGVIAVASRRDAGT